MNRERWKIVRDMIASRPPEGMIMSSWLTSAYENVNCGTVGCIGGWASVAYAKWLRENPGERPASVPVWLESVQEYSILTMMGQFSPEPNPYSEYCSMDYFDKNNSPEVRKACMLHVVDQIIETGTWSWDKAAEATGADLGSVRG